MTPTGTLPIPDEAVTRFRRLCSQVVPRDEMAPAERVEAVATPVVVAELLALAEPLEEFIRDSEAGVDQRDKVVAYCDGLAEAVRRLHERVDELTEEKA